MIRGHRKKRPSRRIAPPSIWLMTDERVDDVALFRVLARLPRGSAVILRHYSLPAAERRALFERVRAVTRARGLTLLLAGTFDEARDWGADGHHGRTGAPVCVPGWLHSAPAHNHHELVAAERAGADVVLVSPLFATRSHPGAGVLGAARFAALARASAVPVIALGGVKPRHAGLVRRLGASGFAAIDGLVGRAIQRIFKSAGLS